MFLIIQTGEPVAQAAQQFGRFSQWFTTGMQVSESQVSTVDVHLGQSLPEVSEAVDTYSGIVITGSPAMVTNHDAWLLKTQQWLSQVFKHQVPTLGVCFGHQLLADMLGGKVTYNSAGRNLGWSEMTFTAAANDDPLLQNIANQPRVGTFVSHLQHVKKLPQSTTLLGHCALDQNHAFRAEDVLWGLQFHPEWDVAITRAYLEARHDDLLKEGFDPQLMLDQLQPCDAAHSLLAHFAELAKGRFQAN